MKPGNEIKIVKAEYTRQGLAGKACVTAPVPNEVHRPASPEITNATGTTMFRQRIDQNSALSSRPPRAIRRPSLRALLDDQRPPYLTAYTLG